MTATEELRSMLDERGVEWTENDSEYMKETCWTYMCELTAAFAEYNDGTTRFDCDTWCFTPEQAIAATLGAGTCKLDDFADVPFSVNYEIEGYDMDSGRDYATLAECSACSAYIIVPPEYHHVLTCDGDEVYQPYRFCPNCGRKVVNT